MTIQEVKQALGSWHVTLKKETPRDLIDQLEEFGHIAIFPGRVNPKEYGDGLLTKARYVGPLRSKYKQPDGTFDIKGVSMAFWLGDEDDKGDVFESAITITAQTFANSIRALLPAGGAVVEGTLTNVTGNYTGRHQYETPRKAITYVTDTYSGVEGSPVEWRVNGDGTLDAGPIEALYNVDNPSALLVRKDPSRDMRIIGIKASMSMDYDVEDYTTRVVLLAQGEGATIPAAAANAPATPYNDIHGNPVISTRLVSESETTTTNAAARAALELARWQDPRKAIQINSDEYDIKGDFVVGDYVLAYDPDNGFIDQNRQATYKGQPIHPAALRVIEMGWPIRANWTVAFRKNDGTWIDLSEYYKPETGSTYIAVGDFLRTLAGFGEEHLGIRPNIGGPDSSIPAAPAFTEFSTGSYQSADTSLTRSALRAEWNTPLNQDGSTIVDGDHYEIRFRVNQVIGYQVPWDTLDDTPYTWDELGTWDALISEQVQASPQWSTEFVGWGTNAVTIMELTPGVNYELQIRAVDSAKPPNQSPWSASSFVTTVGDLIAPSTPAAPEIAGSMTAIQVIHTLGKSSGGTFNLEPDLDHLEVHIGGDETFLPTADNMLGKMNANAGMLLGTITAVQTFPVEQVDEIWVKVVAVDLAGNKSDASVGATVTVDLIDDAHISDLTVSKVTAGTISAEWLNAGRITTGITGERVEMNADGIFAYDDDGQLTVQIHNTGEASFNGEVGTHISGDGIRLIPGSNPRIRITPDDTYDHDAIIRAYMTSSGTLVDFGVRRSPNYDQQDGGNLLMWEDGLSLSHFRVGGHEAFLWLGSEDDIRPDRIRMRGFWENTFFDSHGAIFPDVTVVSAGFGAVSFTYVATMDGSIGPMATISNASGVTWGIDVSSSTGFSVAWSGTAAHNVFTWVFRKG